MKKKILSVLLAMTMLTVPVIADTGITAPLSINAEAASEKLPKPTVKASVKDGKITLSWNKVKGAEAYGVYKYDAGTKKYKKVKITSKTKITISVEKSGTYKYRVYSLDKVNGKYKKGGYGYKKVTVKGDFVEEFMEGVEFGCSKKDFMNNFGGESECFQHSTAVAGKNDDGLLVMGNFEDGVLTSFCKNFPYSDDELERVIELFYDEEWTMVDEELAEKYLGENATVFRSPDDKHISSITISDDDKFIMVIIKKYKG